MFYCLLHVLDRCTTCTCKYVLLDAHVLDLVVMILFLYQDASDSPLMTDVKAEDDNSSFRKSFVETRQKKLLETTKNMPFDGREKQKKYMYIRVYTIRVHTSHNVYMMFL